MTESIEITNRLKINFLINWEVIDILLITSS